MVAAKNIEDLIYPAVESGLLIIDEEGQIWRTKPRLRRAEHLSGEYLQIRVMIKGVRYHALPHRLVWRHIHGRIPPGLTVNHEDGVKTRNRPGNLTLATHSEQAFHARWILGKCQQHGEANPAAKLRRQDVEQIRMRRTAGERLKTIARDFGISDRTVSKIMLRRRWIG